MALVRPVSLSSNTSVTFVKQVYESVAQAGFARTESHIRTSDVDIFSPRMSLSNKYCLYRLQNVST